MEMSPHPFCALTVYVIIALLFPLICKFLKCTSRNGNRGEMCLYALMWPFVLVVMLLMALGAALMWLTDIAFFGIIKVEQFIKRSFK